MRFDDRGNGRDHAWNHGAPLIARRPLVLGGMALALTTARPSLALPSPPLTVSASGRPGTLATLERAIVLARAAPPGTVIAVEPGIYREKLVIDVPGLTIRGTAPGVVLTFDAGAALPGPAGAPWTTSGSASITIRAPDVTLADLTIRNDHDYPARPMQAVALAVQQGGDGCRIERCRIEGWQDTLLLNAATRVSDCRISGNVDFIFGGGAAWIERCEIVSRPSANPGEPGFVAAPSTPACQPHGLIFHRCRLSHEPGVAPGTIFLGRPWRAGGNMALLGQAIFLDCWLGPHIAADGWTWMGYRGPDGDQRRLEPLDARMFESGNRGPGARPSPTRRQLGAAAARALTPASVLASRAC